MNIVIVESPAKAKTINKYLGRDYHVVASYGHVRDLPSKDGSVRPDEDFAMDWAVDARAQGRIKEIAQAVKGAKKLILATDPDREGEAISWHLLQVLKEKKALKDVAIERVVFNAITKTAVLEAMAHPRALDTELVDAYLARRALDYLVGFSLSPILWRKLPGAKSAGRVQSVALRLICEREMEIDAFRTQEYWTLDALFGTPAGAELKARLVRLEGRRLEKFDLNNEASALAAKAAVESRRFKVESVESKPARRNPPPPFTTSTLQQEAARKLGFSATRTMQIAQRLYEGVEIGGETTGLITYMRTDGVTVAGEALDGTRKEIQKRYGQRYVPSAARIYKTKQRNAQEAHEAIRPTDVSRSPETVARAVDGDGARLYELIWKRMMASQMESAELERTTIDVESNDGLVGLRATGSVVTFDGFLALYQEGRDDPADDEDGARLPKVAPGDALKLNNTLPEQHFTEPPPRYSEASLVKKMEELGIGRPSTYASILQVLRDREYVRMDRNRFFPEDKGLLVTAFLRSFFRRYVEYDFTASLEERLDSVSNGDLQYKDFLKSFWTDFEAALQGISELRIGQVLDALNEELGPHIFPDKGDGRDPRLCTLCNEGKLGIKRGKFGAFIGCSNYPQCSYTRPLGGPNQEGAAQDNQPRTIGTDPQTGLSVTLRNGRFGPYIQLGDASTDGEAPKRASIPKGFDPATIELERALALLALPRDVGLHPETGKTITAQIGRFGPYLSHDGKSATLETAEDVFTIGINRAVTVLADRKARGGRPEPKALLDLGAHPEDGAAVRVMNGRFGPYVAHQRVFATVPKGQDPATVTMTQAIELLTARAARLAETGGAKGGRGGGRAKFSKAKDAKPSANGASAPKKAAAKSKPGAKKAADKPESTKAAAKGSQKAPAKTKAPKTRKADPVS